MREVNCNGNKPLDIWFMDWTDNHGYLGDIVRAIVGVIILFIILLPIAVILEPFIS